MKEIKLKVMGMSCGHCEMRVKNALLSINSIKEVVASAKEEYVLIKYIEEINIEEIKNIINEVGYEVIV